MIRNRFRTQTHIVLTCIAIHNFLWLIAIGDELFVWFDNENVKLEDMGSDQCPLQ